MIWKCFLFLFLEETQLGCGFAQISEITSFVCTNKINLLHLKSSLDRLIVIAKNYWILQLVCACAREFVTSESLYHVAPKISKTPLPYFSVPQTSITIMFPCKHSSNLDSPQISSSYTMPPQVSPAIMHHIYPSKRCWLPLSQGPLRTLADGVGHIFENHLTPHPAVTTT